MKVFESKEEAQAAIDALPNAYHREILMVVKGKDALKIGKDGYFVQLKSKKED